MLNNCLYADILHSAIQTASVMAPEIQSVIPALIREGSFVEMQARGLRVLTIEGGPDRRGDYGKFASSEFRTVETC